MFIKFWEAVFKYYQKGSDTLIFKTQFFIRALYDTVSCFNPLQSKRRPLYLKTQSVPRCKHFSSPL